jgi:signal transduction histidine kinase
VAGAAIAVAIDGRPADATLIVLAGLTVVWAGAGLVLASRTPGPTAWLAQTMSAIAGVGGLCWSLDTARQPTGLGGLLVDGGHRLAVTVAPAILFHLLVTTPDGRLHRPARRRLAVAGYALAAAVGLALLADRQTVSRWPVVALWLAVPLAAPIAHAGYRAAADVHKRRMQWLGLAAMVITEICMVVAGLSLLADWPHHQADIALAATGLVPLGLAAGTMQGPLSRVDRVLTHAVPFAGLTALIIVAYLLALATFGRRPDGSERTLLLLSIAAAAGAALAYQPAQRWLGERANRIVYGERVSPDEALRTWGTRLTRAIPLDELLLQLAEALRKSMQLSSAQIWTGADGRYDVAAMVPHRSLRTLVVDEKERSVVSRAGVSGGTWLDIWMPGLAEPSATARTRVAPIAHGGSLLGLIVCERPADRGSFDEDDDRVLTELARQVGLALHNVQLDTALQASLDELRQTNEELRASRVRIVAAGDAERRKLERNLHDGAQQHLVALAVKLRLAKDAVVDDPEDAESMIDEVRNDLQDAIADLRALAHGIFPPLLMSGGLAEALPAAAARAELPITVNVKVDRHAPELEAAVYFCCLEALQNAGKHAGPAATAVVTIEEDGDSLRWEVADDGVGFDAEGGHEAAGHGFVNIRDRMGAFGGSVEVSSTPGVGTTIRGEVPLIRPAV